MHSSLPNPTFPSPNTRRDLLHRLVEAQAQRTPNATAVIWEGERLTYAAIIAAAGHLAHRLRVRGVGSETLVGVCLASSPAQVIALLGILKAGAAYLPLDPDYPAERLRFMLADSRAPLVITETRLLEQVPAGAWDALCLDEPWDAPEPLRRPEADTRPDNLAYVIYTSGSTGLPKGVAITHGSVAANLRWRQETFPLTPRDRLLQTYSFSFDPSVWAIFWPLSVGATLILPRPGGLADSRSLAELMSWERITVMGAGPALWNALLAEPALERCRSLRHAFSGGEALTGALRRRLLAQFPNAALHNVYGPTEATIDASWWTCPRPDMGESATPIGFPLPHASAWILDQDGRPVPDGGCGELHIGGDGLAREYLFRPELTRERFLPNPFDPAPGARLYRTGDLVRRRPDGALEHLGRLDNQIKMRGYRIEIGEVEAALQAVPGILSAAVVIHEEEESGSQMAAFLTRRSENAPTAADLRRTLGETLPRYLIPGVFVFLKALPLTPNGKVDRAALADMPASPEPDTPVAAPPQTPLEAALLGIWAEVLRTPDVGGDDDFFDRGGHSLTATLLLRRIESLCHRRLTLTTLFEHPTARALARHLEQSRPEAPSPLLTIHSHGSRRPFFFLHGDFEGGGYYCLPLARHLGPEQPVYALAPHGLDGEPLPDSVEEMARDYAQKIRAVQPKGPYRLGGYCNGGLIAYEIARQLRAAGEDIEVLWLIEVEVLRSRFKQALRRVTWALGTLLRLSPPTRRRLYLGAQECLMPLALTLKDGRDRLTPLLRLTRRRSPQREHANDASGQAADILPTILYAHLRRHTQYLLRPYDGPLTLVRAQEHSPEHVIVTPSDWLEMAPEARIVSVPGDHFTCLTEQVQALTATLAAELKSDAE